MPVDCGLVRASSKMTMSTYQGDAPSLFSSSSRSCSHGTSLGAQQQSLEGLCSCWRLYRQAGTSSKRALRVSVGRRNMCSRSNADAARLSNRRTAPVDMSAHDCHEILNQRSPYHVAFIFAEPALAQHQLPRFVATACFLCERLCCLLEVRLARCDILLCLCTQRKRVVADDCAKVPRLTCRCICCGWCNSGAVFVGRLLEGAAPCLGVALRDLFRIHHALQVMGNAVHHTRLRLCVVALWDNPLHQTRAPRRRAPLGVELGKAVLEGASDKSRGLL